MKKPPSNAPNSSPTSSTSAPFRQSTLVWVAAAAALVLIVWLLPVWSLRGANLSAAARLTLETQMRDALAKMVWAGFSFAAAWMVWRYLQALGKVVENSASSLAASERTAFFAAQGAETERYARSMSLLGSESSEVRLGGVFALERLARESARDHGPIMEVLAAFVRERAAWLEGETVSARPSADVQAALTVLGRRHAPFDPEGFRLDLHATSLARAYLPHAQLRAAFLYEANLEGTILQHADLSGAWLWKASLEGAVLDGANLCGADLTGAAGLVSEQLQNVRFDAATRWPEALRGEMTLDPLERQKAESPVSAEDLQLPTRIG